MLCMHRCANVCLQTLDMGEKVFSLEPTPTLLADQFSKKSQNPCKSFGVSPSSVKMRAIFLQIPGTLSTSLDCIPSPVVVWHLHCFDIDACMVDQEVRVSSEQSSSVYPGLLNTCGGSHFTKVFKFGTILQIYIYYFHFSHWFIRHLKIFDKNNWWLGCADLKLVSAYHTGVHITLTLTYIYIWVKLPWTDIFPIFFHFFCNFDSCFQALFSLFDCFNCFYGSITCAGVGKTIFLTRHLRLGTWKVPLNMEDFEDFATFSPFVYQFAFFRIDLKPFNN